MRGSSTLGFREGFIRVTVFGLGNLARKLVLARDVVLGFGRSLSVS
jgi:hypothetical protein